jgi:hypothetical protein
MLSRCCKADICVSGQDTRWWDKHMSSSYYECVHCGRPCDTIPNPNIKEGENERIFASIPVSNG